MDNTQSESKSSEEQPLIDIHPPNHAAHSWRDIAIHLATITVGLFIALSLEGCIEWQHHRHLVREARENIRSEIAGNQKELRDALSAIDHEQKQLSNDIVALNRLERDPAAHGLSIGFHVTTTDLNRNAWETAKVTGAVAFMPYAEVKEYDSIYAVGEDLETAQRAAIDAEAPLIGLLLTINGGQIKIENLSKSQYERATEDISRSKARLFVVGSIGQALDKQYSELLVRHY